MLIHMCSNLPLVVSYIFCNIEEMQPIDHYQKWLIDVLNSIKKYDFFQESIIAIIFLRVC